MARTPPGPDGEPLFGSSRRYARDPFSFLETLERAYGAVSTFGLGPRETFVVTDPALIEQVLVGQPDRFRKPDIGGDALDDLLGQGLLLSEGDTWERQRELLAPAYGMDRLEGVADRIADHAEALVADWSTGETIDVEREMTTVTLAVISDVMLGVELPDHRIETIQDALVPVGARFEPDPRRFAVPDWVPMPGDRRFAEAVTTLDTVVGEVLTRHDDGASGDDVVSLLARARERGDVGADQVRDEVVTVLLAGHDTTALTLSYTFALLSEHPSVATRVREEIDAVVGSATPNAEHVRSFEYVEWVLMEAMRLYPPVYSLFRTPTDRVELGGYDIPESAIVMLPQWAVHRSERHWTDPETFNPERFHPDRRRDRPNFAFFPFGGGPRRCIGSHLAMLEAQLILATVGRRYHLAFQGSFPIALQPSITAHPRDGLAMTVQARDQSAAPDHE